MEIIAGFLLDKSRGTFVQEGCNLLGFDGVIAVRVMVS